MNRVYEESHYNWLSHHLSEIFQKLGIEPSWAGGIIAAHGDKCYGYKSTWEEKGIPFAHGVAIYLLSYIQPFSMEVRKTADGEWVAPVDWVANNYDRFKEHFPPIGKFGIPEE